MTRTDRYFRDLGGAGSSAIFGWRFALMDWGRGDMSLATTLRFGGYIVVWMLIVLLLRILWAVGEVLYSRRRDRYGKL